MAKECGWSCKYIGENLTYPQMILYYRLIQEENSQGYKTQALVGMASAARAYGSIKEKDWQDFLAMFDKPKKIDPKQVSKNLTGLKNMGIPVEEN